MYYGGARRSRLWCALVLGGTLVVWGTLEAAMVFALRVRELLFVSFHVLSIAAGYCNRYCNLLTIAFV
jgi:hypothetical protein